MHLKTLFQGAREGEPRSSIKKERPGDFLLMSAKSAVSFLNTAKAERKKNMNKNGFKIVQDSKAAGGLQL